MMPRMPMLFRSAYLVIAGLFTLLAVAGLLATWLALDDGSVPGTFAFASLTALSAALVGGALEGIRATYGS